MRDKIAMTREDIVLFLFLLYFLKSGLGFNIVPNHHLDDVIFEPDRVLVDFVKFLF